METRKYKKQQELSERDKTALKAFRDCRVPRQYYALDARDDRFDFNFNYQEIYDYADALLRGQEISLRQNFVGLPASAVNEDFRKLLDVVGRRDPTLEDFCEKFSSAIAVIARAAR